MALTKTINANNFLYTRFTIWIHMELNQIETTSHDFIVLIFIWLCLVQFLEIYFFLAMVDSIILAKKVDSPDLLWGEKGKMRAQKLQLNHHLRKIFAVFVGWDVLKKFKTFLCALCSIIWYREYATSLALLVIWEILLEHVKGKSWYFDTYYHMRGHLNVPGK